MKSHADDSELLSRAALGDHAARSELFDKYQDRLRRMVQFRLDTRLRRRIDPSDVVQDSYLEASQRLADYMQDPQMPFFLWVRFLTLERLVTLHRQHLGVQARDVRREVATLQRGLPPADTATLAAKLLGKLTSPSQAAMRAELKARLQEALDRLDPLDREILALRHFEQMNTVEAAKVLGIGESGTSSRYIRALKRLKSILSVDPDTLD